MEQPPSNEKIATIDLNRYLEFIASLNTIDGKIIDDEYHAFYVWLHTALPEYQDIDNGVSLLDIYEKNVVNGDMSQEDFTTYCVQNEFPVFVSLDEGSTDSEIQEEFYNFPDEIHEQKRVEYEAWALQYGIDIAPNSVTTFLDSDGITHKIRTDYLHNGETVV